MPESLSLVIVHLVFSTKDRAPLILPEMRPRLHAYMAEVARSLGCVAYRVGGVSDHVHLALTLPRTLTQSDLVKELKTTSNHWLEKQDRAARLRHLFHRKVPAPRSGALHRRSREPPREAQLSRRIPCDAGQIRGEV